MVVLHFVIIDKNPRLDIQLNILSREDATIAEKEIARALEIFFAKALKSLLKEQGLKVKTKKLKAEIKKK